MVRDEDVTAFERDGAVVLRGVFSEFVAGAREAIAQNMDAPSWRERTYQSEDGSAPFFQDYVVWDQFDGYRALVRQSGMAESAARLMGSPIARMFHDHVLVKEPGNSNVTPWHQDAPYYLCRGRQSVSFWVPLDPVPRARTIEFVGGSHRWGKDFIPMRFDGTPLFDGMEGEAVPDIEAERGQHDILGWEMEPGDAVAFDFRTLHGAPANASDTRRRVVSFRWVGADAVFGSRPGSATSPAFPDLAFRPGAPFDAPEFPVIWPAG